MLAFSLPFRPTTVQEVLRAAVLKLQQAHIESASLDARLLLEHVMEFTHEQLLFSMDAPLTARQHAAYRALVEKRAAHQPVAQLVGKREFFGLAFKVTDATLDPRPDSETLIEAVMERFPHRGEPLKILDLGTGTGCLMLTLLKEYANARATGVDCCPRALSVAKENALALGLKSRAAFLLSDWCEEVNGHRFDIVIANPPYIPTDDIAALAPEVSRFEPRLALDGGKDGLDCYRAIMRSLPRLLVPGGIAVFEIGVQQQAGVEKLAAEWCLKVAGVKQDLGGLPRCVVVSLPRPVFARVKSISLFNQSPSSGGNQKRKIA